MIRIDGFYQDLNTTMGKIKVGIIGGTGYTGVELLRILANHPESEVLGITSRGEAGKAVAELFPSLRGHYDDLRYSDPETTDLNGCDVVFAATPNGVAMKHAPELMKNGVKLIDFSADFRIDDVATWEQWYGMQHACPELLADAVYGLPEVYREQIKGAQLIANPGCYPTSVQLGFLPLVSNKLVDVKNLIADCKSGVSGAGRSAAVANLFSEVSESVKAYAASGHRHLPEIKQGLSIAAGEEVGLVFVPHLMPMIRGIHATLYADLNDPEMDVQALYEAFYKDEPFVDVMPAGSHPDTRSVRGTNMCRIAIHRQAGSDKVIVLAAEDNVVKGAAGQAVQNMNLMCGLDETTGLNLPALVP